LLCALREILHFNILIANEAEGADGEGAEGFDFDGNGEEAEVGVGETV
jgi:hypothetical protein